MVDLGEQPNECATELHRFCGGKAEGVGVDPKIAVVRNHSVTPAALRDEAKRTEAKAG